MSNSSSPSSPVIELRFIHKCPTTPKDDEIVRITPYTCEDGSVKYLWRYSYNSSTVNVVMLESIFHVTNQMREMADLARWDSEPYSAVQLLLPSMPSVLFEGDDFREALTDVGRCVSNALRNWPTKMCRAEASELCQEGVERTKTPLQSSTEAAREVAAAHEAAAAATAAANAAAATAAHTRSGRAYRSASHRSSSYQTPCRDSVDVDGPPPLVRLSRHDGYGSYFSDRCGQNVSSVRYNPEDDQWDE